jgi:hypothetical protein
METEATYAGVTALLRLKGMKVGEPIEGIHLEAIRYFVGHMLDLVPDPRVLGTVEFPEVGKPVKTGVFADTEES